MQAIPVTVDQLVGQTISGYSVDQLLGQGSLSAVYLVHQSTPMRRALLTVFLLPSWCEGQQRALFMERFSKLGSILVSLDHPHILPTYSFGERFNYPYLVTGFLEEASLASVLKQQARCTPVQTLALLKQIASALDYTHDHGIVHGTLKPANILLDSHQEVHITGLGLAHMLEMRGIGVSQHSFSHLYSIADTLLYSPEYLAPEVVEGMAVDARSDIYALGIILYELLCGKPPFSGTDPLAIAVQHVQQPIPSLRAGYAQAPAALDLIIQRTLDRDPDRRYKSASKLAGAFERVLNVLDAAASPAIAKRNPSSLLDISDRSTLPWFEADAALNVQQQPQVPNISDVMPVAPGMGSVMPPAVPWKSVRSTIENATQQDATSAMQIPLPSAMEYLPGSPSLMREVNQAQAMANGALPLNVKSTNGAEFGQGFSPGTFQPKDRVKKQTQQRPSSSTSRRKVLLFATGGVVAAGLLTFGGLNLSHILSSTKLEGHSTVSPQAAATKKPVAKKAVAKSTSTKTTNAKNTGTKGTKTQSPGTQTMGGQTMGGQSQASIIGMRNQAVNSAKSFTNPADGHVGLLVHLPNNNFAAYDRACTHQGVAVNYDPASHTFICPLHGSVFDPAQNGMVLKGPATLPLPSVRIQISANGTITVV